MKVLVKYYKYYGKNGEVHGLFICGDDELKRAIGSSMYLEEILQRHLYLRDILREEDVKIISTDQEKIAWLYNLFQDNTLCGYNPLYFLDPPFELAL